jgi:hypothetical protein
MEILIAVATDMAGPVTNLNPYTVTLTLTVFWIVNRINARQIVTANQINTRQIVTVNQINTRQIVTVNRINTSQIATANQINITQTAIQTETVLVTANLHQTTNPGNLRGTTNASVTKILTATAACMTGTGTATATGREIKTQSRYHCSR